MKRTSIFTVLALACAVLLDCSCNKNSGQEEDVFYQPVSEVGKAVLAASEVYRIYNDTTFVVAPGVEETDVHFQTMTGWIVRAYFIKADLNTPGLQLTVSIPDDAKKAYSSKQTLSDMAGVYDAPGSRVVAMTNGDYWDTGALVSRGPIHRNGNIINEVFNYSETVPQQALSYIAVLNDGTMMADLKDTYYDNQSRIKECTGGGVLLLKDGLIPQIPETWTARDPRTALGFTEDNIAYMLVADGRQDFLSYGMTYAEESSIFQSLGCKGAVALDGGGSSELLIRHPIARTWQVRNSPADGSERAVFNGWMVTVDEP